MLKIHLHHSGKIGSDIYEYHGTHDLDTISDLLVLKFGSITMPDGEIHIGPSDVEEEVSTFLEKVDKYISPWVEYSGNVKVRRYEHRLTKPKEGTTIFSIYSEMVEDYFRQWDHLLDLVPDHRVTYELLYEDGRRIFLYHSNVTLTVCFEIELIGFLE